MSLIWVLAGIAVLGAIAMVAAGRGAGLAPAQRDRPDVVLPQDRLADGADVDALRFSVGLRGYRMDEVDDVLDRLATDLAVRDARIAELEGTSDPHAAADAPADPLGLPADQATTEPPVSRTMIVPVQELAPEVPGVEAADDADGR